MQITVSGKQVDTGEALRQHVADQLGTIAQKYFDHALEAQVTFSRNRTFFHCDITMHAGRNLTMRAEGEAADAHAAFDTAAEHIAKRLRRYRRKVNDHARDLAGRARPEAARQVILQLAAEEATAGPEEINGHAPAIVAELAEEIEQLTVGEAVMRLDLSDRTALMFRDRASGALGVVYRRKDGNIGWIDSGAARGASR